MDAPPSTARVVYATFGTAKRSGGVHVMIQHVQLLREAGHDAWLWLPGPDPVPAWFDRDVPTLIGPALTLTAADLLVLPEVPVVPGHDPAPGARKVILNQNHFYTFAAAAGAAWSSYPDWTPQPSVWAVSDESVAVLRALHPQLSVTLVPNFVDAELTAARKTELSIAWFTRKRPREASLVGHLLAQDPRLAGVRLLPVTDQPWPEVAAILRRATVFLAFGHTEGFGLPVAEALAAGCLVIGYDGGGGAELFEAPGAWRVPEQRPLLLVDQVADVLRRPAALAGLAEQNQSWLTAHYGPGRTRHALTSAVADAFAQPGRAALATHPARWLGELPADFYVTG